jgi:hypothetical protein
LILSEAVHYRHVLALDVAGVFEALAKSTQPVRNRVRQLRSEEPDRRHRLLRARRERPRHRCAAEQRDERAPLHSITSSARASTFVGERGRIELNGSRIDLNACTEIDLAQI